MNMTVTVFEANSDIYRAAFAVRRGLITGGIALIAVEPSTAAIWGRLHYEPVIERVTLTEGLPNYGAYCNIAGDFFDGMAATVSGIRSRRQVAADKAAYWSDRLVRWTEGTPEGERDAVQRRRITDARCHYARHISANDEAEREVRDVEGRWLRG